MKKDKAFFFVDYEGIRQLLQQFGVATVPNCTAGFASGPCQITATNPITAAAIANTLSLYPAPQCSKLRRRPRARRRRLATTRFTRITC